MGALTGIVAGVAAAVGVVTLARFAERKTKELRDTLKQAAGQSGGDAPEPVIEFEKDPVSGAYRQKEER